MWHSSDSGTAVDGEPLQTTSFTDPDCRCKAVGFCCLTGVLVLAPDVILWLLPGFTVGLVVFVMASSKRNESASRWGWFALFCLLAGCVSPWLLRVRYGDGVKMRPVNNAAARLLDVAGREPLKKPNSGEEVMLSNGTFIRISDPNKPDGSVVFEGWQSRLLMRMTTAIQKRQQQVVLVFTHQDCPGCDHLCRMQLPVLRRAIADRASLVPQFNGIGEDDIEPASTPMPLVEVLRGSPELPGLTSLGGDRQHSRLFAPNGEMHHQDVSVLEKPLRIFVLDASEFRHMAMRTMPHDGGRKGFPRMVGWRPIQSAPLVAQGYLDDDDFENFLEKASMTAEEVDALR